MKGVSIQNSLWKRGLYLGVVPEMAAAKNSTTPLILDHDLDSLPEAGRRMTVADLAEYVEDLAARLSSAGVRSGDRIVVYKTANFDVWVLATAASRIGAVPVMLSPALDSATVSALLDRLDQPHLLIDVPKLDVLAEVPLERLTKGVIIVAGSRPGVTSLADLAGSPSVRPVFRGLDDPALISHTSGTTGLPKLVVHTARNFRVKLRPQFFMLSLMRRTETVAVNVPFVHSRMIGAMSVCLANGMPLLLVKESNPEKIARFFLKHRPGLIEALPNSYMEWEGLADDERKPFGSVKYFSSTFDAIHPRTISKLVRSSERRGALFFQVYGQSEVGPAVGRPYFPRSAHRSNGRCIGYPLPTNARIRVVSRDGKRPSKNNPGYIEASWEGIAKTYFGEEDRFDANMHGKWWRTGDVGYRTWRGCLHLLDREVDMIPGVTSSLEIEDVVTSRLVELTELVVVSGPKSVPTPVVCVNDDHPLDMARWRAAVADFPQLADPIQIPLAELPRTATLKVQRIELSRQLRERFEERA